MLSKHSIIKGEIIMRKFFIAIAFFMLFVNVCNAELQLGITIPTRTITVDGQATDWDEIDQIVLDNSNDSSCGNYTDITYVFLAKDDSFLYWRIDTNSGNYDSYDYPPVIRFLSHEPSAEAVDGDVESSVWENTGRIDIYNESIHEWDDRYLDGDEYGMIDQIAEGKVPLSLFNGKTFTFSDAFIHNREGGGGTCDEVTLSQGSNDDGGGGGGGCFVTSILKSASYR
jgi:hypothetical protein